METKIEVKYPNTMMQKYRPNEFVYMQIYGPDSLRQNWDLSLQMSQRLYKQCLKRDCTWQDILGKQPDDVLL